MADEDFIWGLALGCIISIPIGIILFLALTQKTQLIQTISPTPTIEPTPTIGSITTYVAKNSKKTYTNTEEWEFLKDPETGRVRGVRVKRHAEEN